jgi:hypothetical protein
LRKKLHLKGKMFRVLPNLCKPLEHVFLKVREKKGGKIREKGREGVNKKGVGREG